jgi:hypothetical protein
MKGSGSTTLIVKVLSSEMDLELAENVINREAVINRRGMEIHSSSILLEPFIDSAPVVGNWGLIANKRRQNSPRHWNMVKIKRKLCIVTEDYISHYR